MLAVGRALMLNGKLILMDEPSEGLAPTIVGTLMPRFTPSSPRVWRSSRRTEHPCRNRHGRSSAGDGFRGGSTQSSAPRRFETIQRCNGCIWASMPETRFRGEKGL